MTVLVAFDRLLVEGRFTEDGGGQVVVPGGITHALMPCPISIQRDPTAPVQVGTVLLLHRQAHEFVVHTEESSRYGMVTWVWNGTGELRDRSVDEVECLIRDYRPQAWIRGTPIRRGADQMMLDAVIIGVSLARNERPGDSGWRIIDRDTADAWAAGSLPVQGWDPS